MSLLQRIREPHTTIKHITEITSCIYMGPADEHSIKQAGISAVLVDGELLRTLGAPVYKIGNGVDNLTEEQIEQACRRIWDCVSKGDKILLVETTSMVVVLAIYILRRLYVLSPKAGHASIVEQTLLFLKQVRPCITITQEELDQIYEYNKKLKEYVASMQK